MRKELEEVRGALVKIANCGMKKCEERGKTPSQCLDYIAEKQSSLAFQALGTLDRILGQDEDEMVRLVLTGIVEYVQEAVEEYSLSIDKEGNPLAVDFHRFKPEEMAKAAIRALGLMKEGG